ncbi:MAG: hypothetical protein ACREQ2_17330 [Candidatus Binatia bacterium]
MGAQALERRNDNLLSHLQSIRDHTRGLFEAEASIAVSAAHALENVKIRFFVGHVFSLMAVELRCNTRKSDLLRRNQFDRRLRLAFSIHHHADPNEDAPRLPQPDCRENNEGIFSNEPRRLIAANANVKLTALSRGEIERRLEPVLVRFELAVGQTDRQNL